MEPNPAADFQPDMMDTSTYESVCLRDLTPEHRELQTRYWGLIEDDDLVRCPTCSHQGHMANMCKARDCTYCGASGDHFLSDCPQRRKCNKCRERGHDEPECPSKLARSEADGLDCDFCHGNHKEDDCSWLWRTFQPSSIPPDKLNKAAQLPVFCYNCAASTHWGDDCRANSVPQAKQSTTNVFSASFGNQFLTSPIQPEFSVQQPRASTQQHNFQGQSVAGPPTAQTRQTTGVSGPPQRQGRRKPKRRPPKNL